MWNNTIPTKKHFDTCTEIKDRHLDIHLHAQSATFNPELIDSANFFFFESRLYIKQCRS
jgi:hypothetical protein